MTNPPDAAFIEQLARQAIAAMPDLFRQHLEGVAIHVDDFATPDVLQELGIEDPWELTGLYEMGKTITSTLNLEDRLKLIVATGLKTLKARGGVLRLEERKTGELKIKYSVGDYHQNPLDEKLS